MTPQEEFYRQRLVELERRLAVLNKRKNALGWLRLFSLLIIPVSAWQLWSFGLAIVLPVVLLLMGLFLYILSKDLNNSKTIENTNRILQINKTEIEVLQHHYTHLPDGNIHRPETHDYASDLDIFGRSSLYQYLNRTNSEQGGVLLAQWLLNTANKETILLRQESVKELSLKTAWRQQLQSHGMSETISVSAQDKIAAWLYEPSHFLNKSYWRVLRILLPSISCTALALHIAGIIAADIFFPVVAVFLALSMSISKLVIPAYKSLNKTAPQLESLSNCVSCIEQADFNSALLQKLRNNYKSGDSSSSKAIYKLKKILDRFDIRLNPLVFLPLNTFLFWDLQQAFALEKWKTDNKTNTGNWFDALAETECLCSLANLSFNHPAWVIPLISDDAAIFSADKVGHPLIPEEKMVASSFTTSGIGQLNLITGSNMAGKSTFLRSVGVNTVLAMMGAPVCADRLAISIMKIMSSMRVSDNLEESTSTFYAELKKLKEIIEAVNRNEKVFLLLDEILRGTNSTDRHTGSLALIKQLIHRKAAGLIATHDLELAKLTGEFPEDLHNYHFDVQISGSELYFDYKLKRGICQSMNASLLMKKIGIEL